MGGDDDHSRGGHRHAGQRPGDGRASHRWWCGGPGSYPPGAEGSLVLSLDPTDNRYLSFLSMVVPSNDAFIGNDDATGIELFDAMGNFVATDFTLTGSNIWGRRGPKSTG